VQKFLSLTPKPVVYLVLPVATGSMPCCQIDGTVIRDQEMPLTLQLAAEVKMPTIDLNTPTMGHPEYFSDGVHPTDAGYALIARLIHDGLLH
jgi:acyl-CoA thioesterase-1